MATVLAAIGSWITGVAIPAVTQFIVGGVTIIANLIGWPCLMLIGFAIALITTAVILYYKGFFNDVRNNYKDVQLDNEKKVFEQLEKHKGEAAHIDVNLSFFDKELTKEVENLVNKENIKNEGKKDTMKLFIKFIVNCVTNAKKNGENKSRKNFDLYEGSVATLTFIYDKNERKIHLNFAFYDDKIVEYLIVLLKILKQKGYQMENEYYEDAIKNFQIEDDVNKFKIILINI